jgi:7-cyano-7-deazaguanine synthase
MIASKSYKISKRGVILLSGGIDSATTLYYAKGQRFKLTALIFDYGQRHKKEIECAKKLARRSKTKYHVVRCDLPWIRSSLTNKKIKVTLNRNLRKKEIPLTYVSGRNIIFLSYALSLAESIGAKGIFIGAHIQDYSGYPDCRPQFLKAFEHAANYATKIGGIKIIAPLVNKDKKAIIKMGIKLGVPFNQTWSCYQGTRNPCLECDSCRFRISAFKSLGLIDPLLRHE